MITEFIRTNENCVLIAVVIFLAALQTVPEPLYEYATLEGAGFALASFAVMSLITAVIIVVTKKFWLLDFLLYGKQRRRNL